MPVFDIIFKVTVRTSDHRGDDFLVPDVEGLPSGSMKANRLVLAISMLAFNTLRFIGQRALAKKELLPAPPTVARRRLRATQKFGQTFFCNSPVSRLS
jgi:hypothetical protein